MVKNELYCPFLYRYYVTQTKILLILVDMDERKGLSNVNNEYQLKAKGASIRYVFL